jgi:hypothetical protein
MASIGLIALVVICGGGLLVVVGVAVAYYLITDREK